MAVIWRGGDFEIRADERRLLARGQPQSLGARAFDLLVALVERRDRVVGKGELLDLVWPGVVVEENNLTVQLSALRKVLGSEAIATVPGRGYRFTLPLHPEPAAAPPAPAGGQNLPTERPSIAVLPFEARSEDPVLGFLADGLVEDVIAQLARMPGFLVISRASSFEFRRRAEGLPAIARALGVRYLVEGSVRPAAAQLRVATQLVEAESGRVLWSGQLDSARDSAGDLQEAIARGIISQLEPELTRAEITLIRRRRTEDVDAWGHYHGAVGALGIDGWTESAVAQARAGFARALELDPDFALARAHAALVTALGLSTGLVEPGAVIKAETHAAAERALAQAQDDSQVLGYAGCTLADLGERGRGTEILRQALEIDPSNAQAHVALGAAQALLGEFEAGIERMRQGMRISPRDRRLGFWGWALSQFLLHLDRPEEALREAQLSVRRDARLHLSRVCEAAALRRLGRGDEARIALAEARRLRPGLSLAEVARVNGRRMADDLSRIWDAGGKGSGDG